MVTGGLVAHPLQRGADVLRFFRETCASAPDELMLVAGLLFAPDGSGTKLTGIVACHAGSLQDGEAAVRPIKAFGPPVMDAMGPIPYCDQNGLLDGAFPKGALSYWKAQFLTDLSDDAIRVLVDRFDACPSPMSQIVVEIFTAPPAGSRSSHGLLDASDTASTWRSSRSGTIRRTPSAPPPGAATRIRR